MVDRPAAGTVSPLSKHHPTMFDFSSKDKLKALVRVPPLRPHETGDAPNAFDIGEWSHNVVEWLGLVALESPRIQAKDMVDPYLSRWTFPEGTSEHATPVRALRWEGMIDSGWVTQLLITCMYVPSDPFSLHSPVLSTI